MNRRDFLRIGFGSAILAGLPQTILADIRRNVKPYSPLNIRKRNIHIGLDAPFKMVHISDTHIALANSADSERKIMVGAGRSRYFPNAEHYLDEAIRYAQAGNMPIIHTGDLIDFVSEANLDFTARHFMTGDFLVSAGNHEFSQFVGEAREDEAYKQQSYAKVQDAFPNDLTFFAREIGGVNFVAIDNVYYNVTERQHELVEKEFKRGLPVVLLCHVPFYTPKLCEHTLKSSGGKAAYVAGVPLSITETFEHNDNLPAAEQWRNRSVQQRADKPTLEFQKWLHSQKRLKAILCGHCHEFFEEPFSKTAMQYVVGANYNGDAYEFAFD